MATYYNLPVYKQSYDLLLDIFKLTKEFNREYKYTIGEELKDKRKLITDVLFDIFKNDENLLLVIPRQNVA